MNYKLLTMLACIFLFALHAHAQVNITGTVTDARTGETLPGVNVIVQDLQRGAATDMDGEYEIVNIPSGTYTLEVTYIGYRRYTAEVEVGSENLVQDISLQQDVLGLEEVVVTGVSGVTPQRNLAFTVGRVSERELKEVPAISAASSLQGKMAGVRVIQNTGMPGSAASIRLRGSTALVGNQSPLIIVDGVMLDESLADIDALDIESIEVLKGASAASLYGSRAANGVVNITTQRGQYLSPDQLRVVVRNEVGRSSLTREVPWNNSHHYELDSSGNFVLDSGGNRVPKDDFISDQPYSNSRNLQEELFTPGNFMTNYVNLQRNTGSGNYAVSFTNTASDGILFGMDGYSRKSFRLNVDQDVSDRFRFSASTSYNSSDSQQPTQGPGSPFFRVLMLQPNADIYGTNPDGSQYNIRPDPQVQESNPLYELANVERDFERQRLLGDVRARYSPLDWISIEGSYSLDRLDLRRSLYTPKGLWQLSGPDEVQGLGSLNIRNDQNIAQTLVATATLNQDFTNGINARFRASYQYENRLFNRAEAAGSNFAVGNIPRLNITQTDNRTTSSLREEIITENIFGILDLNFRNKYILSTLVRQDGSSEFGADERYAIYYRLSGAYRITEDIRIAGIQELKIRASYGTAGLRPEFSAQYETYSVGGGTPSPDVLGNRDLKPAFSTEIEIGTDIEFLNRFNLSFSYANQVTEDSIVEVPLSAKAGGFNSQWQNAGTITADTYEATLGVILADRRDLQWTANLNFDRTIQTVTKLDFPSQFVGPNEQSNGIFFLNEGEPFGIMYGQRWVKSFEELQRNPAYASASASDFTINSDGYLIQAGTEGTTGEAPIRYFELDENGELAGDFRIGDTNPDFNMSLSQTFQYKGWSLYTLLDASVGGEIYNLTKQWIFRELRHGDIDQTGKPQNEKKAVQYYNAIYNANTTNEYFVEDATYLKLREVAINYTFGRSSLGQLGNMINSIRVGAAGRNLLTFTNYSGFDPEVSGLSNDISNYRIDSYSYPNYRTITGVIEITF